jgi:hypothetical protein
MPILQNFGHQRRGKWYYKQALRCELQTVNGFIKCFEHLVYYVANFPHKST